MRLLTKKRKLAISVYAIANSIIYSETPFDYLDRLDKHYVKEFMRYLKANTKKDTLKANDFMDLWCLTHKLSNLYTEFLISKGCDLLINHKENNSVRKKYLKNNKLFAKKLHFAEYDIEREK